MVVKHNLLITMSEQDTEQLDATNPNEELELDTELDDTEDVEALKEELEREREARRQLTARAKKTEAELKSLKGSQSSEVDKASSTQFTKTNNALTEDEIDARVLRLQGMSEELLGKLKSVAKATGKSMIEAQSDEVFLIMKEKMEAEAKSEKAKLGASKGSGTVKKVKDFNTPNLSDEEHRALWREKNGR